jgi:hypothetical protein
MLASYLFAWLVALGISLGAMANLMVHTLTHGRWGVPLRPPLVAAVRLLPLVALLFLPVLIGYRRIFPWAGGEAAAEHAAWWLNAPFFLARSVAYLAIWNALAWLWLRADARSPAPWAPTDAARRVSAAGLVIYTFTVSLAAFDWIVSLTPGLASSGFGLVVGVGQMLAGAAFGVAASSFSPPENEETRARSHDLGNILLMYVMTWAYLAFTQFLIIWAENLPREIAWYVPRLQTGWWTLGAFLVAFQFFVPFLILLSRDAKRAPRFIGGLAAALLAVYVANVFWLVLPAFRPDGLDVSWTDLAALVALAAAYGALWRRTLHRREEAAHA